MRENNSVGQWCNEFQDSTMLKLSNFRRAHFKVLLLVIILCGLISYYIAINYLPNEIEIAKKCYLHNGRNPNGTGKALTYFEDLLSSTKKPKYDQGIFFIETKCSDSGIADLKPRYDECDTYKTYIISIIVMKIFISRWLHWDCCFIGNLNI